MAACVYREWEGVCIVCVLCVIGWKDNYKLGNAIIHDIDNKNIADSDTL